MQFELETTVPQELVIEDEVAAHLDLDHLPRPPQVGSSFHEGLSASGQDRWWLLVPVPARRRVGDDEGPRVIGLRPPGVSRR